MKKIISKIISPAKITKSAKMNKLLIITPIKIENPIKPSLYSFFQGRKKVFNIKESEKTLRNALFKDTKN